MSYQRKCKNWLDTFYEWSTIVSQAPESYHIWTGLFTLASALRRHVQIPKRGGLGGWECPPNIYVMFIAEAGFGKTTTLGFAEDLLGEIPDLTKSPELITKEALLSAIAKSTDNSICIRAPEFGEFIVKSGVEMYSLLTNMYDPKKKLEILTLSRGPETIVKPCFNLIGATTPEWLAKNMPEDVLGGGFASRVIFIFESELRDPALWRKNVDYDKQEELYEMLRDDIKYIAGNIYGDFDVDEETEKFTDQWYLNHVNSKKVHRKLKGYMQRKPAHMLKVAQLIHVAYSDELVLNIHDVKKALHIINMVEERMPKVFEQVGKNPYTLDMTQMYEFIKLRGKVSRQDLLIEFKEAAEPAKLAELIGGLMAMKYVTIENNGKGEEYLVAKV